MRFRQQRKLLTALALGCILTAFTGCASQKSTVPTPPAKPATPTKPPATAPTKPAPTKPTSAAPVRLATVLVDASGQSGAGEKIAGIMTSRGFAVLGVATHDSVIRTTVVTA